MGRYPGLAQGAQCNHNSPHKREEESLESEIGNVMC